MKMLVLACGALLILCTYSLSSQTAAGYGPIIEQGKTQLQAGNADQALALGQRGIILSPSRWEAYALAGGALMNLKRYEEAADDFSKAIDRAPSPKQAGLRELRRQCAVAESGTTTSSSQPPVASPLATNALQAEVVLWKSIENSANETDFQTYLAQYPTGTFAPLAKAHINEMEERKINEKAATEASLSNSALAGARTASLNGNVGVTLATGQMVKVKGASPREVYLNVFVASFQGRNAISFPTTSFCRGALVFGQVDYCASGKIFVTDRDVAFQRDNGQVDFVCDRSRVVIKSEGGREGDTFSIYDNTGQRHRFGSPKFDSPFISFLQSTITSFSTSYDQMKLLGSKAQ
jgi:hypothetical protein